MSTTTTAPTLTPGVVLRNMWAWLKAHPKARYTLIFLAVCTACYFFNISTAAATDTETSSRAFDLPLVGITDTHGVPIWRYVELPMDPGNGPTYILRSIRYFIASILWALYAMPILLMIAMVEWIVSFEWLSWIAAPFETVAEGVSGVMEAWMIVTLGLVISVLWIGVGYLRGRTGAATIEFVMVVLVFGVIASPVADPFSWMTGGGSDTASESGFIREAADAGAEAGGMTINQEANPENVTLAGSIVDITLRHTMLNMAFGSSLSGDCEDAWNTAALESDNDAEDVREEVIDCDDAVADANQTDSFVWFFDYLMAGPAAIGVMFLLGVFLFFLIWQVFQAFISAIVAVIRAFLALFPGNSRTAWLNSLFQVVVSGVLIGIYIFMLTVYMWGMGELVEALPAPLIRTGSILLGILIIIAAITFWKMKKAGKSVGERLSKALGKTGLSKESPEKKPSNFGTTAKNLGSQAYQMRQKTRMLRALKTGTTAAATVGTGGVGGVAAKAATSTAGGMAMKAATKNASPGANLPGVKGVLPGAAHAPKPSLPAGNASTGALPAGRASSPGGALPAGRESAPAPASAAGLQPVVSVQPPAGSENAPSSPLPPREAIGNEGVPPTVTGAESVKSGTHSPTHEQHQSVPVGSANTGVPTQERPAPRVNNIPEGNYGSNWVHKSGQMHQPVTINQDGTAVQNIPREEKMARAVQSGDRWIMPGTENLKPGRHSQQPSRRNPEPQPASPAQSSERSQQKEHRPTPKPMQPRPTESGSSVNRPPRPEPVDVSARANQASSPQTPSREKTPAQRPTPRAMQRRAGGEVHRKGDNQ